MSQSLPSPFIAAKTLLVHEEEGSYRVASLAEVLEVARQLLSLHVRRGMEISSPSVLKDYLRVQLGALEHELFAVLHLDAQHRVNVYREMFRGTLTQTTVYPRELVREALALNTAAVVLVHNHPSG